jgi:alpha,alpha-trehalase
MDYQKEYKDCLDYIDTYWDKIICKDPIKATPHIIQLPHPYITPNDKKFTYIYYWDSYFMFTGIKDTRHEWIMREMVDNFAYIFKKYHILPNFNAPAGMNRSQPPLFSSMIMNTYLASQNNKGLKQKIMSAISILTDKQPVNKRWLGKMISVAKKEYTHVWVDLDLDYNHSVKDHRLSRYGDRDIGYAHSSELESGWDFTSRFYNRCDEFLPVDLNVFLMKYELDFADAARILKQDPGKITYWDNRANLRKNEINKLMWNDKIGFYFDYCYTEKEQSEFFSLAGFLPLWTGIASQTQAKRMVGHLKRFETAHGLTITDKGSLSPKINLSKVPTYYRRAIEHLVAPKQWDYPHIWPPLEYLTVLGLLKYGYTADAIRIMNKSVQTQAKIFRKYKTFFEKIDGVTGDRAKDYHYINQSGFGWTNAVFTQYIHLLTRLQ